MQAKTLIIGAGAAGLMCAAQTGAGTVVIDHAKAAGEKIRISGGGRCNFTNMGCGADNFISQNRHFAKSALKRYTQWDFIEMVDRHDIAWHEKTLGQLFCDETAKDIIKMLIAEAPEMDLRLRTSLVSLDQTENGFRAVIETGGKQDTLNVANVVVACGGKSIPKMGATDLGYKIAQKFGHQIIETRPALVPLTFSGNPFASMSGTAAPVRLTANDTSFDEALLFTHRGLSGPAVLQVSSYWTEGDSITVDLASNGTLPQTIKTARSTEGRKDLTTILAQHLPTKLVAHLSTLLDLSGNVGDLSDKKIDALVDDLRSWSLTPNGSEGYRTAEVTLGGVDTDGLSSKTMISKNTPGLYFIGEVVDVTGWLGGYNFQWAWSSGWAAGQDIAGN